MRLANLSRVSGCRVFTRDEQDKPPGCGVTQRIKIKKRNAGDGKINQKRTPLYNNSLLFAETGALQFLRPPSLLLHDEDTENENITSLFGHSPNPTQIRHLQSPVRLRRSLAPRKSRVDSAPVPPVGDLKRLRFMKTLTLTLCTFRKDNLYKCTQIVRLSRPLSRRDVRLAPLNPRWPPWWVNVFPEVFAQITHDVVLFLIAGCGCVP